MASLLLFATLSILSIARAQDRAPHGLVYESPMAFSPSAYDFFHPNTEQPNAKPCGASKCPPWPLVATVQSNLARESVSPPQNGGNGLGTSGIFGIMFGCAFVAVLAMGAYYVVVRRRTNLSQTYSVRPDV